MTSQIHWSEKVSREAEPRLNGLFGGRSKLEFCPRGSQRLGVQLFLKREDQLDDFGFGHKIRKLKFLAHVALQQGAQTMISAGSLPSGQNPAVAFVAKQLGILSHLIYTGDSQVCPARPCGSYLTALMLADEISWYEQKPWTEVESRLREIAAIEVKRGRRPFLVRPGMPDWPGVLGSVELGLELVAELQTALEQGKTSDYVHVFAPVGSGVTIAGLEAASEACSANWQIHGVMIGGTRSSVVSEMLGVQKYVRQWMQLPGVQESKAALYDEFLGNGYDNPTLLELDTLARVALEYGRFFDINYMLKTFLGLETCVERGIIKKGSAVVLVVTGGRNGLFDGNPNLVTWCQKRPRVTKH